MAHTNAGERAADTPRPAATLVILQDSLHGPEVLLTVRPKTMRFMGGAVVFPGGAVASADLDERWEQLTGLSRHDAAAKIDVEDGRTALGAYVAALREAFEEVGFILGHGPLSELSRDFADEPRRFLERCPMATDICHKLDHPPLEDKGNGHFVACHLVEVGAA